MYEVQLVLKCEWGEFEGQSFVISEEALKEVFKMSKSYYSGSFELTLVNGDYIVFSPDIVQKSILIVRNKKIEEDVQE